MLGQETVLEKFLLHWKFVIIKIMIVMELLMIISLRKHVIQVLRAQKEMEIVMEEHGHVMLAESGGQYVTGNKHLYSQMMYVIGTKQEMELMRIVMVLWMMDV